MIPEKLEEAIREGKLQGATVLGPDGKSYEVGDFSSGYVWIFDLTDAPDYSEVPRTIEEFLEDYRLIGKHRGISILFGTL